MIKLPSFKYYLNETKSTQTGEHPLYLRVTYNRRKAEYTTGIKIFPSDWNPKKEQVKAKHREARLLNSRIDDILHECKRIALELGDSISASNIKKRLTEQPTATIDFFIYYEKFREQLKEDGHYDEWKHSKVVESKLKDFINKDRLPFTEITTQFLEDFKRYLFKTLGNGQNTVYKEFQRIKRITKQAIKEGVINNDPFTLFEQVSKKKTGKDRLSYEQIQSIEALPLDNDSALHLTRDTFLFSFYCAGIRFADVCTMKWKNIVDGRLKYEMGKTGRLKTILLQPQALKILDYYRQETPEIHPEGFIFPLLDAKYSYEDEYTTKQKVSSKNTIVNKNLKRLAQLANIQETVSFHVSRHSFADYARKMGISVYDISKALGHSDIAVTQTYLKSFDEQSLDESMNKLFN